jgi:prepilin-type N-terminal cleavage/methylation domain-containing protein
MKSQRGFSLVEIVVAAAIGVGVAVVVSVFFLMTLRVTRNANAQAALQRQGTAIAEELGRRARPVVGSLVVEDRTTVTPVCLPLATNDTVLVIPNPPPSPAVTCMFRDTGTPPQLMRCTRPNPGDDCTPTANLLSGSPVPLFATAWSASTVTPCAAAEGTCDAASVCSVANQSCSTVPGATVVFSISDGVNRPETFGITIVATRHQ